MHFLFIEYMYRSLGGVMVCTPDRCHSSSGDANIHSGSTLLRPLAHHTSAVSVSDRSHQFSDLQPRESHFHLATSQHPIYIHSHVAGPFVPSTHAHSTVLQVYTSGTCGVSDISIDIDWRSSLGRAGSRYWSTLGVWCVGVVGILVAGAWRGWDLGDGFGGRVIVLSTVFD